MAKMLTLQRGRPEFGFSKSISSRIHVCTPSAFIWRWEIEIKASLEIFMTSKLGYTTEYGREISLKQVDDED